jgi:hypothetical protein
LEEIVRQVLSPDWLIGERLAKTRICEPKGSRDVLFREGDRGSQLLRTILPEEQTALPRTMSPFV